ncbi:hypothetical protein HN873_034982 [Arachis hypogaea]|uniref:Protein kinase domain-containing protein n=1 Tax=Arachis hypogaea TaxID=3818 RepID=A0A445AN95_ARAHY|nr:hypothetical protein Ahy_B01g051907 [Arachis hypogaea]
MLSTIGTPGCIARKMFSRMYGEFFYKSDVYSYGMLILEMIGGEKNCDTEKSHSSKLYFSNWIYQNFEKNYIGEFTMHPNKSIKLTINDHFNQYFILYNLSCLHLQDFSNSIQMHLIVVYMRQIQQLKN